MVELLFGDGYIKLEKYFLDWTKIEANADQIKDPDLIYPDQVFKIPPCLVK